MINIFQSRISRKVILPVRIVFFTVLSIFHTINARIDPDIHHDGYIYAAAIASSEGLIPHRDFFAQYGPITPILQGFWLKLTEPTLLNLRYLSVLLLLITTWVTYSILRQRCSEASALLLVAAYNVSTPIILPYLLPWPTVLSTLIILISLKMLLSTTHRKPKYLEGILVGSLLALGVFVRIHVLVVIVFLVIALVLLKYEKLFIISFLTGSFITIGVIFSFLIFSQSFMALLKDMVFWPLNAYSGVSTSWKLTLANAFVFSLLLIYPSLYFLVNRLNKVKYLKLYILALLLPALFLSIPLSSRIRTIPAEEKSYLNPYFLMHYLAQDLPLFIPLFSIGLFVALTLVGIIHLVMRTFERFDETKTLTFAVCMGSITQMYPSPDQLHAWWIAPIFIAALPIWRIQVNRSIFVSFVTLIILFNGYKNYLEVIKPRYSFTSPALIGMLGKDRSIDEAMNAAAQLIPSRSGYFHCGEGAFAAASGRYLSALPDYVSWGPQTKNKISLPGIHFSCNVNYQPTGEIVKVLWTSKNGSMIIWRKS
jgi:hypothetical protein